MAKAVPAGEPEARRRVLEAVLDYPGLHVRAVARLLGLAPSHVDYHAESLLDAELIMEAEYDGYRRLYPKSGLAGPPVADSETLALLRGETALHTVLLLLDADSPVPHGILADRAGVAKSTLSFHLNKLSETGVLQRTASGDYECRDPDHLKALLVRWRPVPELMDKHLALWLRLYGS